MIIKMLQNARGSEDCFHVTMFDGGVVYTVTDSLGQYFIREGVARNATLQDQADQIAQFGEGA